LTLDEVVPDPQYRMIQIRTVSARLRRCGLNCAGLPCRLCPWGMPSRAPASCLPGWPAGKHRPLAGRTFLDVTPIPVLFSERFERGPRTPMNFCARNGLRPSTYARKEVSDECASDHP
jgi:hypothetical protein